MKNKKVYIKNIRNSNIEIEFLSKWLLNLEDNLKILGIKRDLIFKDLLQNIVDSNYHKECINNSDIIHTKNIIIQIPSILSIQGMKLRL